jgi:hypothetical protein
MEITSPQRSGRVDQQVVDSMKLCLKGMLCDRRAFDLREIAGDG